MPDRIRSYELIERIATGGMAEIFLARRTGPGRFEKAVAIKRLLPHLAADPTLTAMFLDEARLAARLNHPKVVQIYDLGEEDGSFFIAMEYLLGENLRSVLEACARAAIVMTEVMAARIVADVAEGLHYAHTATDGHGRALNVVHRDVGPRNTFLTSQGYVKLVDFGIAKAADRAVQTMDGYLRGKLHFMAPEQLARAAIDHRVDVWALGITLFEMVAGSRPTAGLSRSQTIRAITAGELPTLRSRAPHASAELERIVSRALAAPERRFQSAGDMQDQLEELIAASGTAPSARDIAALLVRCFGEEHFEQQLEREYAATGNRSLPRDLTARVVASEAATVALSPVPATELTPTVPDAAPTVATPVVDRVDLSGAKTVANRALPMTELTSTVPDAAVAIPALPVAFPHLELSRSADPVVEAVELPRQFGDYLLLEQINTGGMAEVFCAKVFGAEGFERLVAIKRILPHLAEDDNFVRMFVDEAHIAVQLTNANIVQVYELGELDGQLYIVMEYVHGMDLRRMLRQVNDRDEQLPVAHALYLATCVCNALDYAHRRCDLDGLPLNIVHRDVSPHNVLVGFDGSAKLTDFGIAKARHRVAKKTQAGMLKGKLAYMSPEQSRGGELDRRSDVFGVGSVLWEMLTGEPAFIGSNHLEILEQLRGRDVDPPSVRRPDIPPELDEVVLRALARNPEQRYHWAGDLAEDLQRIALARGLTSSHLKMAAYLRAQFAEAVEKERGRTEGFLALTKLRLPRASPRVKVKVLASRSMPAIPGGGQPRWMTVGANPTDVTDPATIELGTEIFEASGDESRPPDPLAETVPVVPAQRPTGGLRAWILAALAASLVGVVLAAVLLTRGESVPRPPLESTPPMASPSVVADADAQPEHPDLEADEGAPDDRPVPRASPAMRELQAAMRSKGLLAGDDAELDDARKRLLGLIAEDRGREAKAALPQALELVRAVTVDAKFVAGKLQRFHKRFERLRDTEFKAEVQPIVDEAVDLLVGGEPERANVELNRAIIMCRKWAARRQLPGELPTGGGAD